MRSLALSALVAVVAILLVIPQQLDAQVIYSSELVDPTGWGYSHFGGTGAPIFGVDTATAEFDWDYSAFGIPEAPNSDGGDAATRGLKLTANDFGLDGGDQVAVHHQDAAFTGQYTLQVDVWANWASSNGVGVGSTEHAGVYVGFDPVAAQASFSPSQNGAGVIYDTDGDCGNCDYILVKDAAELDTFSGQYEVMDFGFGNQQGYDNTDGDLPMLFPEFDIGTATNNMNGSGLQPAGAGGYQWMTVTIDVDTEAVGNGMNGTPGLATVSFESARNGNSITIGTVDNSVDDPMDDIITGEMPVSMEGGIALMMVDFFGGTPSPFELGFVVFDNVRVSLPSTVVDGDFDDNGAYECNDVDQLISAIVDVKNGGMPDLAFDLTGDGNVDDADLVDWRAEAGAGEVAPALTASGNPVQIGDATLDGTVDGLDFIEWNNNKFTSVAAWCAGDFTADGIVDGLDFIEWNNNKFTSADHVAVPEPTGLWLLLVALPFALRRAAK